MTKILFTTSVWPTSWLIRKITKEDCSHCALYINGRVVHCNFKGFTVEPIETFLKHNTVLHAISVKGLDLSVKELQLRYGTAKYDYGALLYLALRYICP